MCFYALGSAIHSLIALPFYNLFNSALLKLCLNLIVSFILPSDSALSLIVCSLCCVLYLGGVCRLLAKLIKKGMPNVSSVENLIVREL